MVRHPEIVVVVETSVNVTVTANKNNPDKVSALLKHAHGILFGDEGPTDAEATPSKQPFLRQMSNNNTTVNKKKATIRM